MGQADEGVRAGSEGVGEQGVVLDGHPGAPVHPHPELARVAVAVGAEGQAASDESGGDQQVA